MIWKGYPRYPWYPCKPKAWITGIDANNLFGPSMMQPLPTEILHWVNPKIFNLENYSEDSLIGCFLEVDLGYPDELHDLHDHSLAAVKMKVTKEILSNYQLQIIEDHFFLGENEKIALNLGNKKTQTPLS